MDANLQPHQDLHHLVPKRKIYPKSITWIHDMVYKNSMMHSNLADEALRKSFHDISLIWNEGSNRTKTFHKYYTINRTRYPEHLAGIVWPQKDLSLVFPDTIHNFRGYKDL